MHTAERLHHGLVTKKKKSNARSTRKTLKKFFILSRRALEAPQGVDHQKSLLLRQCSVVGLGDRLATRFSTP